jgi:TonB family protein
MRKRRQSDVSRGSIVSRRLIMTGTMWLALWTALTVMVPASPASAAGEGEGATHQSDHDDDPVILLEPIHIHGLRLNKDQQLGPITNQVPPIQIPPSLVGKELDDWMKLRVMVSKDGKSTVVILEPPKHRELATSVLETVQKWKFEPQMNGDDPVDGELNFRIHFRN